MAGAAAVGAPATFLYGAQWIGGIPVFAFIGVTGLIGRVVDRFGLASTRVRILAIHERLYVVSRDLVAAWLDEAYQTGRRAALIAELGRTMDALEDVRTPATTELIDALTEAYSDVLTGAWHDDERRNALRSRIATLERSLFAAPTADDSAQQT